MSLVLIVDTSVHEDTKYILQAFWSKFHLFFVLFLQRNISGEK